MSRQNYSAREFNPSNQPGTCLFCGCKLQPWGWGDGVGMRGEGYFCTIVDALEFATIAATKGARYVRSSTEEERSA